MLISLLFIFPNRSLESGWLAWAGGPGEGLELWHTVGHTLLSGDFYFVIILGNDFQVSVLGLVWIISKVRLVLRPRGCRPVHPFITSFSGPAQAWMPSQER